jgi:hypothetical protein
MTLKSTNIDSCEVSRNIAAIVVGLRVASGREECCVIEWPQSDQMSTRWHGESGMECACGCGPVR